MFSINHHYYSKMQKSWNITLENKGLFQPWKDRFSSREDAIVITQILPMHCLLLKANKIKLIWKKKRRFKLKCLFCCTQKINILCTLLFPVNWEERWLGQDEGEETGATSSLSFSWLLFPTLPHMKKGSVRCITPQLFPHPTPWPHPVSLPLPSSPSLIPVHAQPSSPRQSKSLDKTWTSRMGHNH